MCEAPACAVIPTVPSYTDITLDPDNPAGAQMSVFVYNLSKDDYIKTPLPDALVFMVNLTDKENIRMCYAKTGANGRLAFNYDPQFPGCLDYWFIFCPLSAAAGSDAAALTARKTCLDSTRLENGIIDAIPTPCDTENPPSGIKNYPEHILSHNVFYICNKVAKDYAPLCWPLMLILGLLLGASFAVGRNPFQMFDMSSPRLARGRQYQARVQNKNFDLLTYVAGAAGGVMTVKSDVKSIKTGGLLGPMKSMLGMDPKRGDKQEQKRQDRLDKKNGSPKALAPATPKAASFDDSAPSGGKGGGQGTGQVAQANQTVKSGGPGSGTSTPGKLERMAPMQSRVIDTGSQAPKILMPSGKAKPSGKKTATGAPGAGSKKESPKQQGGVKGPTGTSQGVSFDVASQGLQRGTGGPIGELASIFRAGPKGMGKTGVDELIDNFSLKGKNFGQALLAILKLLTNILLDKYGMSTDSVAGMFKKDSWKGVGPTVKTLIELVKLLLALYSMVCEISNFSKAVKVAGGKGGKAKGFMDDTSSSSVFKVGTYDMNVNALLGFLDPRMQAAGTGAGVPYPFNFITSPVLGGLKLGLTAAASAIDTAVDRKRHGVPEAMATTGDKDGSVGVTTDSQGNSTYYNCQVTKDAKGNDVRAWTQCDGVDDGQKAALAKAASEAPMQYLKKDGTSLDDTQRMDHNRRMATAADAKAEAGDYLRANFGGVFSDARKEAIGANISALRCQARALRDKGSSLKDLQTAQLYVEMTRNIMGKIHSNDTFKNAIAMAHIPAKLGATASKDERDAATADDKKDEEESAKKKMAARTRIGELQTVIDTSAPGSHAYNAAKGEITDLQATLALSTVLENVVMPFTKQDLKDTNKALQEYFTLQLKATTAYCETYFSAGSREARNTLGESFKTFTDGFADFESGNVKEIGELGIKVNAMSEQLSTAQTYVLPGISNGLIHEAKACENLLAASGLRATAQANVKKAGKDGGLDGAEKALAKAELAEASAKAEFGETMGVKTPPTLANGFSKASSKGAMVDAGGKEVDEGTKGAVPLDRLIEENDNSIKKLLGGSQEMKLAYQWSRDIENSLAQGAVSREDAEPVQDAFEDYTAKPTKAKHELLGIRVQTVTEIIPALNAILQEDNIPEEFSKNVIQPAIDNYRKDPSFENATALGRVYNAAIKIPDQAKKPSIASGKSPSNKS
jgi:hypothetical protein